jgi:hypothetical protein
MNITSTSAKKRGCPTTQIPCSIATLEDWAGIMGDGQGCAGGLAGRRWCMVVGGIVTMYLPLAVVSART